MWASEKKNWNVFGGVWSFKPFVFANCHFLKLVSLSASLWEITFQRDNVLVPEKDIPWAVKTAKRWKKLYISKKQKKIIYKFSKVNALRKGRSGTYSQVEHCLNFTKAERKNKAVFGSPYVQNIWMSGGGEVAGKQYILNYPENNYLSLHWDWNSLVFKILCKHNWIILKVEKYHLL